MSRGRWHWAGRATENCISVLGGASEPEQVASGSENTDDMTAEVSSLPPHLMWNRVEEVRIHSNSRRPPKIADFVRGMLVALCSWLTA